MTLNAATESSTLASATPRKSLTDSLVAGLATEFPGSSPCEIRIAVLQAESDLWPKKDTYIVMDHARDLLRRGPA